MVSLNTLICDISSLVAIFSNLFRPNSVRRRFFCRFLEFESIFVGKVKNLSALNLDGNPLEHPPMDVVKHGIKAIQQYLRDEHIRRSKCANENLDSEDENYDEERLIDLVADVWASSDEDTADHPRRLTRSPHPPLARPSGVLPGKSKYFLR